VQVYETIYFDLFSTKAWNIAPADFSQDCRVVRSQRFLGGIRVRFLTKLRVRVGFFCPTPDVQWDHFLNHTPKLGIPDEMLQYF